MSTKRFLSFLITVALVFALLPAAASAATHTVATAQELKDALAAANMGDVITLTSNIDYVEPIEVTGFTLTTGAYTLTITVIGPAQPDSAALKVGAGGVVALEEGGQIIIDASLYDFGVYALDGGIATVTDVSLYTASEDAAAIRASNVGSAVTVKGNVEVIGGNMPDGLLAENGTITVEGDVFVKGDRACGADANGGIITVSGRISVETMSGASSQAGIGASASSSIIAGTIIVGSIVAEGRGATASSGSTITVNGDVSVKTFPDTDYPGVNAFDESTVTVNGDVSVKGIPDIKYPGVCAFDGSTVTVNGSILVEGVGEGDEGGGIQSRKGSEVIVRGDVTFVSNDPSSTVYGVIAESSTVTIDGSITLTGTGYGVFAMSGGRIDGVWTPGAEVRVGGNVTVTGTDGIGVAAISQSIVVIDGILSAENYTLVNYFIGGGGVHVLKTKSDGVRGQGPYAYYLMYTDADPAHAAPKTLEQQSEQWANNGGYYFGTGTVYVKWHTEQPFVITQPVTKLTASGATLSGDVIDDGGAWVRERGFVYGKTANPMLGGTDVLRIDAGNGTGSFSASISGLAPNTTYYVRAFATNRSGTAYGESISFTTSSATVPNTGDQGGFLGVWLCAMAAAALLLGIRKRRVES